MKKIPLLSVLFVLFPLAFAKPKVEDNTFSARVVNKSDFDITLEANTANERVVAAGKSAEHRFPLHESSLYDDSWTVAYSIPFTDKASYIIEEKKSLADKQEEFVIENPIGGEISECYAVIENNSNEVFNCSGAGGKTVLPIYETGVVNSRKSSPIYMLAASATVVCKLSSSDGLFLATSSLPKKYIPANISYRKGYVYFLSYDGSKLTLKDARPIQSVKEKLWSKDFSTSAILRGVKTKGDKAYLIGTELEKDSKGNAYVEGFVQCVNSNGKEEWKAPFSVQGSDTYLYDLAFDKSGFLLIAGQIVNDDYKGLLLILNEDGKLQKSIEAKEAVGFDTIRKAKDGSLHVLGADLDGNPLEEIVGQGFAISKVKASSIGALAEEFVQSVSAVVYDDGATFIAGESARQERPTATVVQVKAGGGVDVLYSAREPNSYIMDMKIKRKEGVLLVCGSLDAKDSAGNGGKPFIRCVNIKSGVVEWERIFKTSRYEVAFKIAEFESYGFGVLLVNANDEGNISAPCALVRTNAVGEFDF